MKSNNKVSIACELCKRKNYSTNKSAGNQKRLEIAKFCKNCNQKTLHKEEI
ncbi:50S ribosomal protein L33 [Mycoplasma nasistruthionis]|uniref:Large ribosomal subunit protein bL33 n=1 Tax=Mycoplasma nasistruthionis TaxID=353852 RepID=A0A4Y6I663_9MOLU|nr:50S ribosomal protein L33 [Mycoplasma nasistruthionis]QCZ36498.1 50S ribosomal protein L33 [Mycoplasma nasistruthionis]QDF64790.1 50S ribosomal protein L33 [Mycoplasma nasistruthionis]